MHPENFFIYCADKSLKRRINKVYHYRASQQPYVYAVDGDHIPLEQLSCDYMILKNFDETKISSVHNRQNPLTWKYKKKKKGIKFLKNVVA